MKVLKEITDNWESLHYRTPNHTYLVDGTVIVAYKKWHQGLPVLVNSKKFRLDKKYRKFEELKYNKREWIV